MTGTELLAKELTAMALIVTVDSPKKALLLHSRKHKLWMPPGGHVEPGENPFEAMLREVLEETRLDISSYLPAPKHYDESRTEIPLPMRMTEIRLEHGGKEHYHLDCLYRIEVPSALAVERDDKETADIGWFTLSQLSDLAIPADVLPVLKQELAH